jgi:hypothetical protein
MQKPSPEEIIEAFDEILDFVFGRNRGRDYPSKFDESTASDWIERGITIPIASAIFYQRMTMMHERWLHQSNHQDKKNIPQNLGIFDENIRAATERVKAGGKPISTWEQSEYQWKARLKGFFSKKLWNTNLWGPCPDDPDCRAPKRLIDEAKKDEPN